MANVIDNAVIMAVILFFAIGLYIALGIMATMESVTYEAVNSTVRSNESIAGTSEKAYIMDFYHQGWQNTSQMIKDGFDMLIIFVSCFVFYSSFIRPYSFSDFIVYFIASILVSSLIYWIYASVFNTIVSGTGITLSTVLNFYIQNIMGVMLLNILGFCGAWLFSIGKGRSGVNYA